MALCSYSGLCLEDRRERLSGVGPALLQPLCFAPRGLTDHLLLLSIFLWGWKLVLLIWQSVAAGYITPCSMCLPSGWAAPASDYICTFCSWTPFLGNCDKVPQTRQLRQPWPLTLASGFDPYKSKSVWGNPLPWTLSSLNI